MKSNIGRSSKETKIESEKGMRKKGFKNTPQNAKIIPVIKGLVQKDFDEAVQSLGEENTLTVLVEMLSAKYVKKFYPNTTEIKSIVKRCVTRLIEKVSAEKLGETLDIDNIDAKSKEELQNDLESLKFIKKTVGSKNKTGIDKLIELYSLEIKEREQSNTEVREAENIETERREAEYTEQVENKKVKTKKVKAKKVKAQSKKGKKTKNNETEKVIEDKPALERKDDIEEVQPVTEQKENVKELESTEITLEEKAEEINFYETVQKFTRNFSFLAEISLAHNSMVGGGNPKKFKNFEQYLRFDSIRNIIKNEMDTNKNTEEQAISNILKEMGEKLKVADRKILSERKKVIEKELSKQER